MATRQAKRAEDMDAFLLSLDRNIKGCQDLAGKPLDSDMELSGTEASYREVRGDAVAHVERRRESSIRPVPMDIGNQEEETQGTYYIVEVPHMGRRHRPPRSGRGSLDEYGRGVWLGKAVPLCDGLHPSPVGKETPIMRKWKGGAPWNGKLPRGKKKGGSK